MLDILTLLTKALLTKAKACLMFYMRRDKEREEKEKERKRKMKKEGEGKRKGKWEGSLVLVVL